MRCQLRLGSLYEPVVVAMISDGGLGSAANGGMCAWDRVPPRFLIHDRDSRYGRSFDRRVRHLGVRQVL